MARRVVAPVGILAVALGAALLAGGQDPPVFRTETRAIEVDVFVTDREGRFVRDLGPGDVEVLEDGEPQTVSAWSLIDLPIEEARERSARRAVLESDVVTNAPEGRLYVMLLDSPGLRIPSRAAVTREQMFRFSQRVAHQFVDDMLGPNDLMAVLHVQEASGHGQAFTSSPRLLKASIDRLRPDMESPPNTAQYCDLDKLRASYHAIQTISERLGAVTGRRKALLWVNGRIPYDPLDECEENKTEAALLAVRHQDALRAATRSNVAIYPIDPVGLTADPRSFDERRDFAIKRLAALRLIAEETGGEAIINTNNFAAAYEQVVRANSAYYLLAYQPARDHRDGRFHAITVRARRPGLTVRARPGYLAPEAGSSTAPVVRDVSAELVDALRSPIGMHALGLRLFVAPFKGQDRNGVVFVGADVSRLTARAGAEPRLDVAFLAIDSQGHERSAPLLSLAVPDDAVAETRGVQYTDRLVLPPGRHELRMVAHQPGGATGSAVVHLEIPDFTREPLAMSGLVLGSSDGASAALTRDARFEALLGVPPTTQRRFSTTDTVTALAEVYADEGTRGQALRVEATLANARGTRVRTESATPMGGEPGRAPYVVRMLLAGLEPGSYALTLEARAGRRTVSRQVPIEVGTP